MLDTGAFMSVLLNYLRKTVKQCPKMQSQDFEQCERTLCEWSYVTHLQVATCEVQCHVVLCNEISLHRMFVMLEEGGAVR